jgi:pyruvate,water dikinase
MRAFGTDPGSSDVAVLVQTLVAADTAAVVFSANPISGNRDEVVVNASWGLGESIVGGTVTPDMYVVDRANWEIRSRTIAKKTAMTVRTEMGTKEVPVPRFLQETPSLKDDQAIEMARVAVELERDMGWPADIECAVAGDELFLLQCRPITQMGR